MQKIMICFFLLLLLSSQESQAVVTDSIEINWKENKTNLQIFDVSFNAEIDSSEQHYVEIFPVAFDANTEHDLIIGLHGHGSDRWQFATDTRSECSAYRQFAAKYNMIAVSPDYRAKTSWMGPKAEADIVQIIRDLKVKFKIGRIFIVGASMGGTSALTFAVLHSNLLNGVTSMNGHANHLEYENFQDAITESYGGTKVQVLQEYKKRSAEYWPEKLNIPIAFTVSGNDKSVPPGSAIRLADVLKKIKQKVMIINRPDAGHSTNFEDAMIAFEFMIHPDKK